MMSAFTPPQTADASLVVTGVVQVEGNVWDGDYLTFPAVSFMAKPIVNGQPTSIAVLVGRNQYLHI